MLAVSLSILRDIIGNVSFPIIDFWDFFSLNIYCIFSSDLTYLFSSFFFFLLLGLLLSVHHLEEKCSDLSGIVYWKEFPATLNLETVNKSILMEHIIAYYC